MCAFPRNAKGNAQVSVIMAATIRNRSAATAAAATVAFASLLMLWLGAAEAHVALTYPPARRYDLDFLDNSRTKGPCGMPKGKCKQAIIRTVNMSWLQYLTYNSGVVRPSVVCTRSNIRSVNRWVDQTLWRVVLWVWIMRWLCTDSGKCNGLRMKSVKPV